nr:AI-2E family transporter [uncultured Lichenicoccus sp.]
MLDTTQHDDPGLPEAPPVPATREADVGPVRVSTAQIMGILRIAALAAAAGFVLYLFSHEVLLLFFAVLLGCSLRGAADASARLLHLPAKLMLGLISLLILGVIGGGLWWIGPQLTHQGAELLGKLSGEFDTLSQRYGSTSWGQTIRQHMSGSVPNAGQITAPAFKVAGLTLGVLADLILVLITALYLAISPALYQRGMLRLIAIRHRPRALGIMREVGRTVRRWLLGQIIDMVVIGIVTAVGLKLLHVPVPLALGVLAGLMTFVPYFGAALAGIPAVLVALSVGPDTALYAALVFVLCHFIEGYVLSPLVQRRLVELPPALTLLSLAAAGTVFGPLGVVMGTPLAAAAMVAIREGYVVDVLGDTEAHDPASGPAFERPAS